LRVFRLLMCGHSCRLEDILLDVLHQAQALHHLASGVKV
jgi:hypothetical protein